MILTGLLSHWATQSEFEKLTNFENGYSVQASIVDLQEIPSFGRDTQQVTFEYADENGVQRQSLLEANGFRWYKMNQQYSVSVEPGQYEYVRRQKSRMPAELHKRWLWLFKFIVLAGLLSLVTPFVRGRRS